jgi:predicted O-methyltransferase YrrM
MSLDALREACDVLISEAEFTAPHAECAKPQWWTAHDSESTENEVIELLAALVRALQPEVVVESGSGFGYTTEAMGQALMRNGHGCLWSLEIDGGRAAEARGRCVGLPVVLVEVDSLDWRPDRLVDLAFFDSAYEARIQEFRRWHQGGWLRKDGIACFHDTTSGLRGHHVDMQREVGLLTAAGMIRPVFLRTPRGLAICEIL